MKTSLLADLEPDQKDEFNKQFIAAHYVRKQLVNVLTKKYLSRDAEEMNKEGYDSPSWAYKQADSVGYKRAIRELISLLE